jgi:hypothetical protein
MKRRKNSNGRVAPKGQTVSEAHPESWADGPIASSIPRLINMQATIDYQFATCKNIFLEFLFSRIGLRILTENLPNVGCRFNVYLIDDALTVSAPIDAAV